MARRRGWFARKGYTASGILNDAQLRSLLAGAGQEIARHKYEYVPQPTDEQIARGQALVLLMQEDINMTSNIGISGSSKQKMREDLSLEFTETDITEYDREYVPSPYSGDLPATSAAA